MMICALPARPMLPLTTSRTLAADEGLIVSVFEAFSEIEAR